MLGVTGGEDLGRGRWDAPRHGWGCCGTGVGSGKGIGGDGNGDRRGWGQEQGGNRERIGVELGQDWGWIGPGSTAGAIVLPGTPEGTGFVSPAPKGAEQEVALVRTREGNESWAESTAGGRATRWDPDTSPAAEHASSVSGDFPDTLQSLPSLGAALIAGQWGAPQRAPHANSTFLCFTIKYGNRESIPGLGEPWGRCSAPPQLIQGPPRKAPPQRSRGTKCSPCNGLPEYLLEYFIISKGGKLGPA